MVTKKHLINGFVRLLYGDHYMIRVVNNNLCISNLLVLYWSLYWLMNGLDKFFNQKDLGLFFWYGKDRTSQFSNYFMNTKISTAWVDVVLLFTGFWEVLIFLCFFIFAIRKIMSSDFYIEWLKFGMILSALTFIGFSVFDIVFGDRAELLEHGTFLILIAVSYQFMFNEKYLN